MRGRRVIVYVLSICLLIVFSMPVYVFASPSIGEQPGVYQPLGDNVHLGPNTLYKFRQQKTLDLSGSDIQIKLTEAERKTLKKQAKDEVEEDMKAVKAFFVDRGWMNQDGTRGNISYPEEISLQYAVYTPYQEPAENFFNEAAQKAYDFVVDQADGDLRKQDELAMIVKFLAFFPSKKDWEGYLKNNAAERFNALQSDVLVKQIREKLDVKCRFDLVPLAEDGSEDAKYEVDGTTIKRGELYRNKSSIPFSTVDFGGKDQFYDEILSYMMNNMVGEYGETDDQRIIFNTLVGSHPVNNLVSLADRFDLDDRRNTLESFPEQHIWNRDSGELHSSDDSQTSWNVPFGEIEWPGWHCLLEVGDPMGSYCTTAPGWSYSMTFNLHLNPAVTYYFDVGGNVDYISDLKLDDNGRVVSLSKPLYSMEDIENLQRKIRMADENSVYRFKLIESAVEPQTLGNNEFKGNKEEKILDITGNRVRIYDSLEDTHAEELSDENGGTLHATFRTSRTSHATFVNSLTRKPAPSPVVEKTEPVTEPVTETEVKGVDQDKEKKAGTEGKKKSAKRSSTYVKTGDRTPFSIWIGLVLVALILLTAMLVWHRKRMAKREGHPAELD